MILVHIKFAKFFSNRKQLKTQDRNVTDIIGGTLYFDDLTVKSFSLSGQVVDINSLGSNLCGQGFKFSLLKDWQ